MTKQATAMDLEAARTGILAQRQAVLRAVGEHAQVLAARLWTDAVALEGAINRMRWPS